MKLFATIALFCLPAIGNALEPANVAQGAKDEVAAELAQCVGYYLMTRAMFGPSTSPNRDRVMAAADLAGNTAMGLSARMSTDAIASERVGRAVQAMQLEVKGDWGNFSLLAAKYDRLCEELINHPEGRVAYWVKEKSKLPNEK